MKTPSPNGTNDRDQHGRFAVGNAGGPGNPHGRQVAKLRAALLAAVTDDDIRAIIRKLIERAIAGDVAAGREVLDRVMGKAKVSVEVDDKRPQSPQVIMQQIRLIVARQPELREMLAEHPGAAALVEAGSENG